MATEVPNGVNEEQSRRYRQPVAASWGTGTWHYRVVNCPKAQVDRLMESGKALALGAIIPAAWLDHAPTEDAAAPRLQSIEVSQKKSGGGDEFKLGYLEVDAGDETDGYADCSDADVWLQQQYGVEKTSHGVALTVASAGIPTAGKTSAGVDPTAATDYIAADVQVDEASQVGRVLITTRWRACGAGGFSQRT